MVWSFMKTLSITCFTLSVVFIAWTSFFYSYILYLFCPKHFDLKHDTNMQYLPISFHLFFFFKNNSWRKISMYEIKTWNKNLRQVLLDIIRCLRLSRLVDHENKLVVLSRYSIHLKNFMASFCCSHCFKDSTSLV